MKSILTPTLCLVLLGMTQLNFDASSLYESDNLIEETWGDGRLLTFSTTRPVYSRRATVICLCDIGVLINNGRVKGYDKKQMYSIFLDKFPDKKNSIFQMSFIGELDSTGRQEYHSFKSPWYEPQPEQIEQ